MPGCVWTQDQLEEKITDKVNEYGLGDIITQEQIVELAVMLIAAATAAAAIAALLVWAWGVIAGAGWAAYSTVMALVAAIAAVIEEMCGGGEPEVPGTEVSLEGPEAKDGIKYIV